MFTNLFLKIYKKVAQRALKKEQTKQMTKQQRKEEKKKQEFYIYFKQLYGFVKWMNTKGIQNRQIRKSFWRNVSKGLPVLEETLQQLIQQYSAPTKKTNTQKQKTEKIK